MNILKHKKTFYGIAYNAFMFGAFLPMLPWLTLLVLVIQYPQAQAATVTIPEALIVVEFMRELTQTFIFTFLGMLFYMMYKRE